MQPNQKQQALACPQETNTKPTHTKHKHNNNTHQQHKTKKNNH
jgi:hypothetical protein